jgi:hypothetical protein
MGAASGDGEISSAADGVDPRLVLGARLRVHPGTDAESLGVIVADFGEASDLGVPAGGSRTANPPGRWAVLLDDDTLVFVDSDQISAD